MRLLGKGVQKSCNFLDAVHARSECISVLSHYYLSIIDKASQWNNSFFAGAYRLPVACWDYLSSSWWHHFWWHGKARDLIIEGLDSFFPQRRWQLEEGWFTSAERAWGPWGKGESIGDSGWRARAAHCWHALMLADCSASGAGAFQSNTVRFWGACTRGNCHGALPCRKVGSWSPVRSPKCEGFVNLDGSAVQVHKFPWMNRY